jgi:hypothetical protein
MCKFCIAEMLRIILEQQEHCRKSTDAKLDILAIEFLRCLNSLNKKGSNNYVNCDKDAFK